MWTAERILALAPDPASAKAGQGLASPRKWVTTGGNEQSLWGECQGSGAKPYQTQIDLSEPAFKCSCPSRKFPCKHALALFLMLGPTAPAPSAPPQWVTDWLNSRQEKAQKKQDKIEKAADTPIDPAAQAKRLAERSKKIAAGVADLEILLEDIVRQGLAAVQNAGEKFWQQPAARMVDAQAPGLARMLREIGDTISTGEHWQQRTLPKLARLFLLLQSFKRLDQLPPDLQVDIRNLVGIPVREEDVLPLPSVHDDWCVVSQLTEEEEKLRTQRTWLRGQSTGRHALILEFAFGGQPLKSTLILGTTFAADVTFYPGAHPLRAMIKTRAGDATETKSLAGESSIPAALAVYSNALAQNPFIEHFPLTLSNIRPIRADRFLAVDFTNNTIPLSPRAGNGWRIIALSGGNPVTLFGEFDGHTLTPLALFSAEGIHGLV